jgi:hypothetical protein
VARDAASIASPAHRVPPAAGRETVPAFVPGRRLHKRLWSDATETPNRDQIENRSSHSTASPSGPAHVEAYSRLQDQCIRRRVGVSTKVRFCNIIDAPTATTGSAIEAVETHMKWMAHAGSITFNSPTHRRLGTEFECITRIGPMRLSNMMAMCACARAAGPGTVADESKPARNVANDRLNVAAHDQESRMP